LPAFARLAGSRRPGVGTGRPRDMDVITLGITPPPIDALADPIAYALAGACLVVGAALLVWGRVLDRSILCVAGVMIGLLTGPALAERFGWPPTPVRLVLAAAIGLAAMALARLVWPLLGGAMAALAAECVLICRLPAGTLVAFEQTAEGLGGWSQAAWQFLSGGLSALWAWNVAAVLAVIGLSVGIPVAVGIVRPRLARIVMTSVIGAGAIACGPLLAVAQLRPGAVDWVWSNWRWALGLWGLLAVVGVAVQYRAAIKADRARKEQQEQQEQEEEDHEEASRKHRKSKSKSKG